MSERLPPLNALRAFEAAARHLSFARAAQELHVTPSAISHQIKTLEEHLGLPLFRRLNKMLLLTDEGQALLPGLRAGFEQLADAVASARRCNLRRVLTVSAAPSFAGKWLVPRLDRFRQAQPDIDVRVDASIQLVDFARADVDVGIRYGTGRYPGLHVECLMADEVLPVCSPQLLQGAHALREPEDLRGQTLLHIDDVTITSGWPDWAMWFSSAGVKNVDTHRGPRFGQANLAIQAAQEGHGVVLVSCVLVADDLAAGRLVRLFSSSYPVDFCYYLVCPEVNLGNPKVAAFCDWLREEAFISNQDDGQGIA